MLSQHVDLRVIIMELGKIFLGYKNWYKRMVKNRHSEIELVMQHKENIRMIIFQLQRIIDVNTKVQNIYISCMYIY